MEVGTLLLGNEIRTMYCIHRVQSIIQTTFTHPPVKLAIMLPQLLSYCRE